MPEPLSEMGNLSIITPVVSDNGLPRYSNPAPIQPSYQNWTEIEDIYSCQTALPAQTQLSYMPAYNSNGTIPAYHQAVCPNGAQQALMNLTRNPPPYNVLVPPQQVYGYSFASDVAAYNAANPQYGQTYTNPPFAGGVPLMKNAKAQDVSTPMVEGYQAPPQQPSIQPANCLECMKHVESCNLCKRLSQNSNRKFWNAIWFLIIVIILLVIYIFKGKGSGASFSPSTMFRGTRIY